jgi:hypothetical protein
MSMSRKRTATMTTVGGGERYSGRPGYQAALAVLGNAAERDLRIVEGIDG